MRALLMVAAASFLLLATSASLAVTARGVVFEDRNENGQRDAGEPGIAALATDQRVEQACGIGICKRMKSTSTPC